MGNNFVFCWYYSLAFRGKNDGVVGTAVVMKQGAVTPAKVIIMYVLIYIAFFELLLIIPYYFPLYQCS